MVDTLSTDIALLLFIIGIIALIVEVATPGFGAAVAAAAFLIMGLLGMIFPYFYNSPISVVVVFVVCLAAMAASVYMYRTLGAPQPTATTITESLVGKEGVVEIEVKPRSIKGKVKIDNQIWSATADHPIPVETIVKVIGWEGEELGTSASTKPKKRKGHPNLLGMPMTKLLLTAIASLRSRLQGLCCPVPRQMSPGHLHKGP